MKDIVITVGAALGSTLGLVRSIKKEINCKAYILCTNKKAINVFSASKYVDEVEWINSTSENEYVKSIKYWYLEKDFLIKPILYFTSDIGCFYIANNREWFENKFELCLPSSEIVYTYTKKGLAERHASAMGLNVPKTKMLEDYSDLKFIVDNYEFPVILKPQAKYSNSVIDFKIKVVSERDELLSFLENKIKNDSSLICQEFIPGGDDVSYYYIFYRLKNGSIIDNVGRKILQTTAKGGTMAKGLVEYNQEVVDISRKFLTKINYHGIGGIEYKKYNNKFYFIEMSTRLEGFYKIAEIAHSPLSLASYYDISGNKEALQKILLQKQKDGYIYMDLIRTVSARFKTQKITKLIRDLFSIMFDKRVKLNVYSKYDSKPFWILLKNTIIEKVVNK